MKVSASGMNTSCAGWNVSWSSTSTRAWAMAEPRRSLPKALASSLVTYAREIGSTITAEGIETPEERAALVDLGVPWGQGYHLARPGDLTADRSVTCTT